MDQLRDERKRQKQETDELAEALTRRASLVTSSTTASDSADEE